MSLLYICVDKHLTEDAHILHHSTPNHLQASFLISKLWPENSVIKVQILKDDPKVIKSQWTSIEVMKERRNENGELSKIDPIEYKIRGLSFKDAIQLVLKERLEPICNLKFVFVEDGGDVKISFDSSKGSWSLLGTDCKQSKKDEATMNLGWMDSATILHEFGHVIGLIHEHNNPNNSGIKWDKEKVYKWAEETQGWDKAMVDNNIFKKYDKTQLNGSVFDPNSIMLYFFPGELTTDNKGTDINQTLSLTDVKYINKIYPKDVDIDNFVSSLDKTPSSNKSNGNTLLIILTLLCVVILSAILIVKYKRRNVK